MDVNGEPSHQDSTVSLLVTLAGAWSGSFCMGTSLGYTSPAADSLAATTGSAAEVFRSVAESFWFRCLLPVGAILGSGVSAIACQAMGRRFGLLLAAMVHVIGYAAIFVASSVQVLYFGRFLTGVATGIVSLCVPVYIAEIVIPRRRGTAGGALQLSITAGILYSFFLGRILNWQLLAVPCLVGPILVLVASHFAVESPRWLMPKGRKLEAIQALRKLRGPTFKPEDEECLDIEEVFVQDPTPHLHVLLALLVHCLQQFSGINMIIFYAPALLAESGVVISTANSYVFIAGLQVVVTFAAVSLMDLVGRRRLLTVSSMVCIFALLTIGAYYHAASSGAKPLGSYSGFLPVVLLGLYMTGFSIGLGPVVWLLGVELVPCRDRGLLTGLATAFNWACALAVTWLFESLREHYHFSGLGWFFSSATFVGALAVNYFLPETKGRSLEEILLEAFYELPEEEDAHAAMVKKD